MLGWIHFVSLSSLVSLLFLLLLRLYSRISPSLSSFHLHDYPLQLAQREQLDSAPFYGLVNEFQLVLLAARVEEVLSDFFAEGLLLLLTV